jgi:hypothetical protein
MILRKNAFCHIFLFFSSYQIAKAAAHDDDILVTKSGYQLPGKVIDDEHYGMTSMDTPYGDVTFFRSNGYVQSRSNAWQHEGIVDIVGTNGDYFWVVDVSGHNKPGHAGRVKEFNETISKMESRDLNLDVFINSFGQKLENLSLDGSAVLMKITGQEKKSWRFWSSEKSSLKQVELKISGDSAAILIRTDGQFEIFEDASNAASIGGGLKSFKTILKDDIQNGDILILTSDGLLDVWSGMLDGPLLESQMAHFGIHPDKKLNQNDFNKLKLEFLQKNLSELGTKLGKMQFKEKITELRANIMNARQQMYAKSSNAVLSAIKEFYHEGWWNKLNDEEKKLGLVPHYRDLTDDMGVVFFVFK